MSIREFVCASRLVAIPALSAILFLPCVAHAISIGEITLHSRWGEPLQARVDLKVNAGERVDDACLSLASPDPHEDDIRDYLTKARLAVRKEGEMQYVDISSGKPFNDAFARLRLQIRCPGMGAVVKTLTILPSLDESLLATTATAHGTSSDTVNKAVPLVAGREETSSEAAPISAQTVPPNVLSAGKQLAQGDSSISPQGGEANGYGRNERLASAHSHAVRSSRKGRHELTHFRLRLSGEPIDESRIGKISAEEREFMLARQKFLDADDQMASFLAMQHQVKQLQDEIGAIKLRLAQLEAGSPVATPTVANPQIERPQPLAKPAIIPHQQPVTQNSPVPWRSLLVAGLAMVALALLLGLRRYTRSKSQDAAKLALEKKDGVRSCTPVTQPHIAKPYAAVTAKSVVVQPPVAPPDANATKAGAAPYSPPPKKGKVELSEIDMVMEEAELYAVHNRPEKAIEILRDVIKQYPPKIEAWLLLLSILSSLGKAAEFEQVARNFFKCHKGDSSWGSIQALGRTLDQNNPLYADESNPVAAATFLPHALGSRRPIGDILVEMGVLSEQDMRNCLDEFDPKRHGRFGGYLVSRKTVTLAQLDEALLRQQGVYTEPKPGSLPKLQEMEDLLADFDPKLHGSVGEYLASRNVVVGEQLNQALPTHAEAKTKKQQSGELSALAEVEPLDIEFKLEIDPPAKEDKHHGFDWPSNAHK